MLTRGYEPAQVLAQSSKIRDAKHTARFKKKSFKIWQFTSCHLSSASLYRDKVWTFFRKKMTTFKEIIIFTLKIKEDTKEKKF